ncbi:hypothetical protein AB6806_19475 [Bosea sp. RCC_152_1]|uniref:hypothetical protein n=1 Tax=Bosea sp. RCC_152_1 TaxID=3239228 RepID=UPI0035247F06
MDAYTEEQCREMAHGMRLNPELWRVLIPYAKPVARQNEPQNDEARAQRPGSLAAGLPSAAKPITTSLGLPSALPSALIAEL